MAQIFPAHPTVGYNQQECKSRIPKSTKYALSEFCEKDYPFIESKNC